MNALWDTYGNLLVQALVTHTIYVLMSVGCGFVLGLAGGILLSRWPKISIFPVAGLVFAADYSRVGVYRRAIFVFGHDSPDRNCGPGGIRYVSGA